MGKCLTIVKLVGIGSLGLSSTAFFASSYFAVPQILKAENADKVKAKITQLITNLRITFWSLGGLSTYLFTEAYKRSQNFGKHPYLIYAALAFPAALIFNYYYTFNDEQELINDKKERITYKKEKKTVEQFVNPEDETSPLDNSVYNDLGERTPKLETVEVEVDVPVSEIGVLSNEEFKAAVSNMNIGHYYSSLILGVGFLLSVIGYAGEP